MAQRVSVVLIDDLDPNQEAAETVGFGIDGTQYEIDLSDVHAKELREAVALYVGHARRVGGRKKSVAAAPSSTKESGPSPKEIRTWGQENGYELPERGRIPGPVREAYDAAH